MAHGVEVVRRSERRRPAQTTVGMLREEAFVGGDTWIGTVRTEPGVETGWHHHGTYESFVYVLAGKARMEFGPDGAEILECEPGDVIHVAPGIIHREITTGTGPSEAILFRVGTGQVTFNTEGPEASEPHARLANSRRGVTPSSASSGRRSR
jgi:uncharacterized RmlC-like cupin family protein